MEVSVVQKFVDFCFTTVNATTVLARRESMRRSFMQAIDGDKDELRVLRENWECEAEELVQLLFHRNLWSTLPVPLTNV